MVFWFVCFILVNILTVLIKPRKVDCPLFRYVTYNSMCMSEIEEQPHGTEEIRPEDKKVTNTVLRSGTLEQRVPDKFY